MRKNEFSIVEFVAIGIYLIVLVANNESTDEFTLAKVAFHWIES